VEERGRGGKMRSKLNAEVEVTMEIAKMGIRKNLWCSVWK